MSRSVTEWPYRLKLEALLIWAQFCTTGTVAIVTMNANIRLIEGTVSSCMSENACACAGSILAVATPVNLLHGIM
jgi:hypothetical protein